MLNMFHPDFLEFFHLLTDHRVEWMLVGGYAYQFHVEARVTQDLDVWVKPSRDNLERLSMVVQAFVGQALDVEAALGLLETNKLGFPVAGLPPYRLEVLLRLKGLDFDAANLRASTIDLAGVPVNVIHPHDLIRTKRLAGRPKDLADVYGLVRRYGDPDEN
jgi:hypothetical protein